MTFENVVRVTPEQNGSVTVINSAKNKEIERDGP
jgi:multidrug resistance efflux pump